MGTKAKKISIKPPIPLPPPPKGWSVFRRSGRIQEAERMVVLAIQEGHPELQEYSNAYMVEIYRSYKRKHPAEIALEGQEQ